MATSALDEATKAFLERAQKAPELAGMFSGYQVNVPQLYADIDRVKARQLGVAVTDVFETMQIYLGSLYVNDFNRFGRTYSVRVQADAQFRARADDIGQLKVRSASGEMVPLAALLRVKRVPARNARCAITDFSRPISTVPPLPDFRRARRKQPLRRSRPKPCRRGSISSGRSSHIRKSWPEIPQCGCSRSRCSWSSWCWPRYMKVSTLPLSIIMIVPMGLLAAMTGVWLSGGDNNIFTQIGLIVLVGLSAKNSILIVEFARELEFAGRTPLEAAVEASRLRLRPILMTSLAFVMGVLPLVLAIGAGAEMRRAMGVAVFAGMIGVTAFGLFLTPVFYVLLRAATGNRPLTSHDGAVHDAAAVKPHVA